MNITRRKFSFPTAFTILFVITILAVILTWIIPAGEYSKLSYNKAQNIFIVSYFQEEAQKYPATQESLDKLGVNIKLENFTEGKIRKPIAVPGSYKRVEQNPKGVIDIARAMINGTIDGSDVMVFIFTLGGLIGIINATGSFASGLSALTKRTKGKEFFIIFAVCVLMALGGTTCGLEEEAVAFYPILAPVFIALGYDAIVTVGAIFLASSMGTAFSTVNPFTVVIASNAAGIVFTDGILFRTIGLILGVSAVILYIYWYSKKIKKDPKFSYVYDVREKFLETYQENTTSNVPPFDIRRKTILFLFVLGFPIMVWGVMAGGWWFPSMAASFLTIAFIIMFISGLKETQIVSSFTKGAASLLAVSLIIGMARGVNLILEEGLISDTILYTLTNMVDGLSPSLFVIGLLFSFTILGFFVPSSSGLAVLSMPIMAPLADTVGLPRDIVVSAYNWGQYAMLFLAPTGLVLVTLQMLYIPFDKWVKFVLPMIGVLLTLAIIFLLIQVQMY